MSAPNLDFEIIHAEFRPRIFRYLSQLVGEFGAEDLTQEVFVRVSKALPAFRGESQLSSWVYRIATNVAYDRMRTPAYRHVTPDSLPDDDVLDNCNEINKDIWTGEAPPSPEQQIHQKEELDCFCNFIQNLPETYRIIIFLSEVESMTVNEIAGILGMNTGVVKMRLHRGRARLIQELKKKCKPEDWL